MPLSISLIPKQQTAGVGTRLALYLSAEIRPGLLSTLEWLMLSYFTMAIAVSYSEPLPEDLTGMFSKYTW